MKNRNVKLSWYFFVAFLLLQNSVFREASCDLECRSLFSVPSQRSSHRNHCGLQICSMMVTGLTVQLSAKVANGHGAPITFFGILKRRSVPLSGYFLTGLLKRQSLYVFMHSSFDGSFVPEDGAVLNIYTKLKAFTD